MTSSYTLEIAWDRDVQDIHAISPVQSYRVRRHCLCICCVSRWSSDDAVNYLVRVSGVARSKAQLDVRRIITFPGQAVAPEYGHLKLGILRRLAQSALGTSLI